MSIKDERTFIINVLPDQCGYSKEMQRYVLGISAWCMPENKEYLAFVGCSSIVVSDLEIKDYTIEFLDVNTTESAIQPYDSELFEEIYNVAFDQFFKMMEEELQAV